MAEFRQLHTRIWMDAWFIKLPPEQKLLFIYLFSNQRASVCGLYELPLQVMTFETGLDIATVRKGLAVFEKAGKAFYDHTASVMWVVNMPKYQGSSSPKLLVRIQGDIKIIADSELKRRFLKSYRMDTVSIPYGDGSDTFQSISILDSDSESDSDSVEERGVGGETKDQVADLFISNFGSFNGNGKNESKRWETLVESIGFTKARTIAIWAAGKEIHMTNRDALMSSLETAAKKWQEKSVGKKAESVGEHNQRIVKEMSHAKK